MRNALKVLPLKADNLYDILWHITKKSTFLALVVELADTLDLGSSTREGVRVRLSVGAQNIIERSG